VATSGHLHRFVAGLVVATAPVWATAAVPNDTYFPQQWGLYNTGQAIDGQPGSEGVAGADIAALDAWAMHDGGPTVVVAVVDAGIDPHPEFGDRLQEGYVATGTRGDPYSTLETGAHGTHIAGIVGATVHNGAGIAGVYSRVVLLPIRALEGNVGTSASVADGIVWAVDRGADIVVVPLAYFDGDHAALNGAVLHAAANDVLVIASAGTAGNGEIGYPACYPSCLAVGATNNRDEFACSVSNHGPQLDLAAPGVDIISARGDGDYEYRSGASIATGFVAGVAALVRSFAPQLTAVDVAQLLIDSADDLGRQTCGAEMVNVRRLNARRALELAPAPPLRFDWIEPPPTKTEPGRTRSVTVRIKGVTQAVASASLNHRGGADGWVSLPMARIGDGTYAAELPAAPCGATFEYYLSATGEGGAELHDPHDAPETTYTAQAMHDAIAFQDGFEADHGWTTLPVDAANSAGAWTRVEPVGTWTGVPLVPAQPEYDRSPDAGTLCFVTGQHLGGGVGSADVDGGPITLLSPPFAVEGPDAEVSYAIWFFCASGEPDELTVEFSRNGGASWTLVETVPPTGAWVKHSFHLKDFPAAVGNMLRLRFTVADMDGLSLTEAAVDEVRIRSILCEAANGDYDGDGVLTLPDFGHLPGCWTGPAVRSDDTWCAIFDLNSDGGVDLSDFGLFQQGFCVRP